MTADLTRRRFLGATAASSVVAAALVPGGALPWAAALPAAGAAGLPARADLPTPKGRVVAVFLRGGMDGLSAVVPAGEAAYHDARPSIGVPAAQVLPLDGRFGLHPAMAPLHELYRDRSLAIVHAVGNGTDSRSHFDAQAQVELGGKGGVSEGWLTRLLASTRSASGDAIRAVAISALTPASLRGCTACLATPSLAGFGLGGTSGLLAPHAGTLAALYAPAAPALGIGGAATAALAGLRRLATVKAAAPAAAADPEGDDPPSRFSAALDDTLALLRADVGIDVVTVDTGGWDTHNAMGTATEGTMRGLLADLATSLARFWNGLRSANLRDVTVVVISEFGRRLGENGSGGTDHGSGNVMFVLGDGLAGGGKVTATWPGLGADALVRGDLRGTTDYRNVLVEVAANRYGSPDASTLFPGLAIAPVGVA